MFLLYIWKKQCGCILTRKQADSFISKFHVGTNFSVSLYIDATIDLPKITPRFSRIIISGKF